MSTPTDAASPAGSDLVRACRGEATSRTPVWFMRQAGRSLPEYRKVREGVPMLDLVPPARARHGDHAAAASAATGWTPPSSTPTSSCPLAAAGIDLDIVPGVGPVIAEPVRTRADVERLRPLDATDVPDIAEAVRSLVAELGPTPLIGFAGAPFTLASYLVEGGPSRDLHRTKSLMYGEPELWRDLLARLAQISGDVPAGAGRSRGECRAALRLLGRRACRRPTTARSCSRHSAPCSSPLPRSAYRGSTSGSAPGSCWRDMGAAGADVVGVDFRVPLDEAARRVGPGFSLQGNLDPALLFAPLPVLRERVRQALAAGRAARGHVFNLGHGVPPDADPEVLARIVDWVHEGT